MDAKILFQLNEAYRQGVCGQIEEEVLSEEELLDIQEWVEALIDEGYDLDQYTDEDLYEAYKKMSGKRLSRVMGKVADLSRTSQRFASDTNLISQARRAGASDADIKRTSQKYADRADEIISRIGKHDPEKVKARETQNRRTINVRVTPVSRPSLSEEFDLYEYTDEELYEAYLDEGLGTVIRGLFGKKKEEIKKPLSRGEQLRKKYNVGPDKSDTSAKRQILNRSRERAERDEEKYGDSKYSNSVARASRAAHDRYLRAGYSKYGADLKHGSGNKARRRAELLQREELDLYDLVSEYLVSEGFCDSYEDADVIMANMSDDWRDEIIEATVKI